MADVTVAIAGREYRLACEDGEEGHLRALARELDGEARTLLGRMSAPPDEARMLLMVALIMADRARDAEAAGGAGTQAAAERLDRLAERIETAAESLAR